MRSSIPSCFIPNRYAACRRERVTCEIKIPSRSTTINTDSRYLDDLWACHEVNPSQDVATKYVGSIITDPRISLRALLRFGIHRRSVDRPNLSLFYVPGYNRQKLSALLFSPPPSVRSPSLSFSSAYFRRFKINFPSYSACSLTERRAPRTRRRRMTHSRFPLPTSPLHPRISRRLRGTRVESLGVGRSESRDRIDQSFFAKSARKELLVPLKRPN